MAPGRHELALQARGLVDQTRARRLAHAPGIPEEWGSMVAMQYPEIWSGRRIALPGGWCDLVAAFSEQLHRHAPGCRVAGSSEKYGTLRLDCVGDNLDVTGLLEQIYEDLSETVCQDCGEPGSLRTDRTWYATLCDAHALKRDPR